jgi:hypothetical protein
MKDFEFYIFKKYVKKTIRDYALAKSLRNEAIERFNKINKLNLDEFNKIIFESIYDSLRKLSDSILLLDGYKSYSHEASITYLSKYNFSFEFLNEFNLFRIKRNDSKYKAKEITIEETKKIINFYKRYNELLINIINKKLKELN